MFVTVFGMLESGKSDGIYAHIHIYVGVRERLIVEGFRLDM